MVGHRQGRGSLFCAWIVASALLGWPAQAGAEPAYQGLALHSLANESYPDLDQELDAAQDANANVVRVDISWAALEERNEGEYSSWYRDRIDEFMAGAEERGIEVLAAIHQTPCWASEAPTSVTGLCDLMWWWDGAFLYPPVDPEDFADIAAYLADRYRDQLVAIEVWNEPNNSGFFISPNPAQKYAELVKAAYPKVKAVAPDVKVLAGALSLADAGFLSQLYSHGIRGSYDAISVHPYQVDPSVAPDEPYPEAYAMWTFWQGLKLIRQTQLAEGDETPVWATEFGWTTHTGDYSGLPWLMGVTEETQAEYLGKAYELLADPESGLDFVEAALVYNLRDNSTDILAINDNFGIVRRDFSPKPAFDVTREAFAEETPVEEPPGEEPQPAG